MDSKTAFSFMQDSFAQAAAAYPRGIIESYYTLADQLVHFRVVGHTLAGRLHQAFAHLERTPATAAEPRLTIEIWDQGETGIHVPGACTALTNNLVQLSEIAVYRFQRTFVLFDRINGHMIGCVYDADEFSLYERGRPLHPPLAQWLNDQKVPLIHAGLVSHNGKGVLLAGSSGSGKSTTALTCLQAGYRFLSDDLVGLQILPTGSPAGHSLYSSTYVDRDHLMRFPILRPHAIDNVDQTEGKLLVLLSQVDIARLGRSAEINVIALPRITHAARCAFFPAPKSKALFALVPSSRKVNKSLGMADFESLVQLVERMQCYWLDLGEDLGQIPGCIEKLLATVN